MNVAAAGTAAGDTPMVSELAAGATSTPTAGPDRIRALLAEAVLCVPGVVRLEPTLSTSGPRVLLHRGRADGLHVLVRGRNVDVDVNLATSGAHQARTVTHQVQAVIADTIAAQGCSRRSVSVSVLTIDSSS